MCESRLISKSEPMTESVGDSAVSTAEDEDGSASLSVATRRPELSEPLKAARKERDLAWAILGGMLRAVEWYSGGPTGTQAPAGTATEEEVGAATVPFLLYAPSSAKEGAGGSEVGLRRVRGVMGGPLKEFRAERCRDPGREVGGVATGVATE